MAQQLRLLWVVTRNVTTLLLAISLGTFFGCGGNIQFPASENSTLNGASENTLPELLDGGPRFTIPHTVSSETSVVVPIVVEQFDKIAVCDLQLLYDPEIIRATAVELGPGVNRTFFIPIVETPGVITTSWIWYHPPDAQTLKDGSAYLNITFEKVAEGVSSIRWDNSVPGYIVIGDHSIGQLDDEPHENFYIDGSVTFE